MDTHILAKPTDWFGVYEIKDIADPSKRVKRKELIVSLDQLPYGITLGPNPREPVLGSPVSKRIEQTLLEAPDSFHLLNRGMTIVAKEMEVDNKVGTNGMKRVRWTFGQQEDEHQFYGCLDGGNTKARIDKFRRELDADSPEEILEQLKNIFVNVQVLIPYPVDGIVGGLPSEEMIDLLNDIKEARNTSVQVKRKSLADARRHFDLIKTVLQNESYFPDISWHEGQKGTVDSQLLITLLMMMYPSFCENSDGGEPSNAYGHKDRCLDAYLEFTEREPQRIEKYIRMLPEFVVIFENLQLSFPALFSGRFGRLKEVRIYDEKQYGDGNSKKYLQKPTKTYFYRQELKYSYPQGWIYPIFASFRALLDEGEDGLTWKRDPKAFWGKYGAEICFRFEPHMKGQGYEVKKIATSLLAYQSIRQSITELHMVDMMQQAGLKV